MNKKIFAILSIVIVLLFFIGCIYVLSTNETFFKTKYIGVQGQEIYIPKYSFFKEESGMTIASFYSLKPEEMLKEEIANYMKDFEYYENETGHGYKKGDLCISSYNVINEGLYRRIYITY